MEVKEAIEFLEIEIKSLEVEIEDCCPDDDIDIQVIEANKEAIIKNKQIISLLQQGEKYRLMWEELYIDRETRFMSTYYNYLDGIEQKYLSKKVRKNEG